MSKQRVLVLGAAGFLGSHLSDRLLDEGYEVFGMDNLQTGSLANLEHLESHPSFSFIHHDICEPFHLPVDRIYNLACPASPPHYQRDPVKTTMTSVLGSLNALHLAERCGARYFFASTSEIYGDPEVHPQPEHYRGAVSTIGPRACYDEGKRCAESLTMDFARKHAVDVRIARIFNTYGPRMAADDGRIVSNFVVQALSAKDLTVYGDGSQTRSFCYVSDLVDGICRLVDHASFVGPVNLGNPEELTVLGVAEKVLALTKANTRIVFEDLPEDDPKKRKPDIDVAKKVLGFEPKIPLSEGLVDTIAYFADRPTATRRGAVTDLSSTLPRRATRPRAGNGTTQPAASSVARAPSGAYRLRSARSSVR